jgi:hypothetical protein
MRRPRIATFGIRGRAAIHTKYRKDPSRRICYSPVLLQHGQPVGRSRIFREESHQGAFLFSHVARSLLHRTLASQLTYSQIRDVISYTLRTLVMRPTKKHYDATELSCNFVPQCLPRFGRSTTNCIDQSDGNLRRQSFDHCEFPHTIINLYQVASFKSANLTQVETVWACVSGDRGGDRGQMDRQTMQSVSACQ